jgi:hypothetical protein
MPRQDFVEQRFVRGFINSYCVKGSSPGDGTAEPQVWFPAESELNRIVPDYPHFSFSLYDLELFDGDTVMHVLRTHPKVYVNGAIITNLSYVRED